MNGFFKRALVAMSIAVVSLVGVVNEADAARLGGKKSSGMQRTTQQTSPSPMQNPSATSQQRNPQTSAPTPNNAQKPSAARRWMGPLVGIASALGIAALLSHFGLGEGFASMITLLLLIWIGFMLLRMILNRFRAKQPQVAGYAHHRSTEPRAPVTSPFATGSSTANVDSAPTAINTTSNVNTEEFLRIAKGFFIRLQAANDKKDTDDLRRFLTPGMFAEAQLQIAERGNTKQTTEIMQLNASVLSIVTEGTHDIGSVRFTGHIKCSDQVMSEDFSEVWHFSKWHNHSDQWSLAGIQQD